MISESYSESVFIADFTNYANRPVSVPALSHGVVVDVEENGIIPSFIIHDEHGYPFSVVNNEHNPALFTRDDGTMVSQCECIVFSERNDNRKGWLLFLELKYCKPENVYSNMLGGISQLKDTCNYVFDEISEFARGRFKIYLVISTPGVEPIDPFDASYFDQDFMLSVKEEKGAILKACNEVFIMTPALIVFPT